MALVSLDTMVMGWMLRKTATSGQEYRIIEAEKLLQWIETEKHKVILTATAVGEYLVGLDASQRKRELSSLQKNFHIQPYDAAAAALAAEIQTNVNIKAISAGSPGLYQCVKADVEIIATSIVGQASYFISCDDHFKKINAGRILSKTTGEIAIEMDQRKEAEEKEKAAAAKAAIEAAEAAKKAAGKTLPFGE